MSDEPTRATDAPPTIPHLVGETIATPTPPPAGGRDAASLPVVSPDQYAVEGEFARGGMGRILRAHDRRLGRPVAVKELHKGTASGDFRFVREALVTARLQHPSIVPVYEAGRWPNGLPFYAMKLVSGSALDGVLRKAKSLSERLALLPHAIAVAEAIAYAHSQGIVHRDLKPANVLVGDFGETVVVDWGLAKDLHQPSAERTDVALPEEPAGPDDQTVVGTVMGTPNYMAPEQARGEPVDERADVYALGALYYLLAGQPPHSGLTATEAIAAAAAGPPPPIAAREPEAPAELRAIVEKAMAHRTADRYPSARELLADLKRYQTGQLVSVHAYSAFDLLRRFVRRNRRAVAVAAVLSAVLAVSLVAGVVGVRREARRAEAERDKARLQARKAETISGFLQRMLSAADPRAGSRELTVAQALDDATGRAETELADQPEVQAAVQATIGHTYEGLGLYDKSEAEIRKALDTRRRLFGDSHLEVAKSLSLLAGVLKAKGDFAGAESTYREALLRFRTLGIEETLDAALARGALAGTLQALGRLDDAERLHREAIEAQRRILGNEDAVVAASLNNLAVVLGNRGDFAAAEPLHREALAIMRKVHGAEHVDVAAALRTLASALESQGKFTEAEALFRESIPMSRKLQGPDHPDSAWSLYNYSFLLRRMDKPAEAAAAAREVLALRGKTLPETHPVIAASLQVLGLSLVDAGRPAEGEAPLRESLRLRQQALPPGHWLIGASESALGACLLGQRRYAEAERWLLAGYDRLLAGVGPGHERTKEARARLAALYRGWQKPEKATAYEDGPSLATR
jgi:tetratricopeptide (TPR) repeat protein